jgi:hypothetical protein
MGMTVWSSVFDLELKTPDPVPWVEHRVVEPQALRLWISYG